MSQGNISNYDIEVLKILNYAKEGKPCSVKC